MTPISAALTQTDRDAVMDAVTKIKAKLPFLVDLNASERKALPKMGIRVGRLLAKRWRLRAGVKCGAFRKRKAGRGDRRAVGSPNQ